MILVIKCIENCISSYNIISTNKLFITEYHLFFIV